MEGVKTENNVKLQTYKTRWELGMGQRVFFVGVGFVLLLDRFDYGGYSLPQKFQTFQVSEAGIFLRFHLY
ncbi:hypothetical protein SCA6_004801 [Theobroma cacao]